VKQAEKWAHNIRNPRTLADKLDIKPGVRVSLCGVQDGAFREQLAARQPRIRRQAGEGFRAIFLLVESTKDLATLKSLQASVAQAPRSDGRSVEESHTQRAASLTKM